MKGLFNKVRNRLTRERFVVSTIRKEDDIFETAVFAATFFYFPKSLSKPAMTVTTHTKDEAWDTHYRISARLMEELPARLFQEFCHS
jgi:hypothetical protein